MDSTWKQKIEGYFRKPKSPHCEVLSWEGGLLVLTSTFLADETYCCSEPGCHWSGKVATFSATLDVELKTVIFQITVEKGTQFSGGFSYHSENEQVYQASANRVGETWMWE